MAWTSEQYWISMEKGSGFQWQSTVSPSLILKADKQTKTTAIHHRLHIVISRAFWCERHWMNTMSRGRVVVLIEYIKFYEKLTVLIGHGRREERNGWSAAWEAGRGGWHLLNETQSQVGRQVWGKNDEFHSGHVELAGPWETTNGQVKTECRDLEPREGSRLEEKLWESYVCEWQLKALQERRWPRGRDRQEARNSIGGALSGTQL